MARVKSVYAVLAKTGADAWYIQTYVDDTEAGRKWIKTSGEKGKTYLIVAFRGGPITVEVQTTEKRTLVAVPVAEIPAPSEAEEEES